MADLLALLDRVYAGKPDDSYVERAFADAVSVHGIPKAIPAALVEGLSWDAEGRAYRTLGELESYAARVASAVGVMMTLVMNRRDPQVLARACDLGLAMQLTNIARDVGEDARDGRLYLPADWLEAEGINPAAFLASPTMTPGLRRVVDRLLARAEALYDARRSGNCRTAGKLSQRHRCRALALSGDRPRDLARRRSRCRQNRRFGPAQARAPHRTLRNGAGSVWQSRRSAGARDPGFSSMPSGTQAKSIVRWICRHGGMRRAAPSAWSNSSTSSGHQRPSGDRSCPATEGAMSSGVIIFLEISLVLGLALFFGFRELRNLRRYDRERAAREKEAASTPPQRGDDGFSG